jgi:hypothetical protein
VLEFSARIRVGKRRDSRDPGRPRDLSADGGQCRHEGEISTGRVAGNNHPVGVVATPLQPAQSAYAVIDRIDYLMRGQFSVSDDQHAGIRCLRQAGHQRSVRVDTAREERATMEVKDGPRRGCTGRANPFGTAVFKPAASPRHGPRSSRLIDWPMRRQSIAHCVDGGDAA